MYELFQMDAIDWLKTLDDESVDLIVTDAPYESLERYRRIGKTTRLKKQWFDIMPNERFDEFFTECYRVLKKKRHFYFFCDFDTMRWLLENEMGTKHGFYLWKSIIWDKCLGPDTPVWTTNGIKKISDIAIGDDIALPNGGFSKVNGTRKVSAPAIRILLSDKTSVVSSLDHRFVLKDGSIVEASCLKEGDYLSISNIGVNQNINVSMDDVIPDEDSVYSLPPNNVCLWCGAEFDGHRAAAAHQGRWRECSMSKTEVALKLGITVKQLGRWLSKSRIPRLWAKRLGIGDKVDEKVQDYLKNDIATWYPSIMELNYELGKIIGLYAAEGSMSRYTVSFSFHANEKHLHDFVARFARYLGLSCAIRIDGGKAVVNVDGKVISYIMRHFVAGGTASNKRFTKTVYESPVEFRRGVVAGLIGGDGHWSNSEKRETFVSASFDIAMFVKREIESTGICTTVRYAENEKSGAWIIRFDPIKKDNGVYVVGVEDVGEVDLVDISIDDRGELFVLGNGVVTHNCYRGTGYHYAACHEKILFFEKGTKPWDRKSYFKGARQLNNRGYKDILSVKGVRTKGHYPTEKPVELTDILVRQSTNGGEVVIDPFMGSCPVGESALRYNCTFYGNDQSSEAYERSKKRLEYFKLRLIE